jgi:hypothetical protein
MKFVLGLLALMAVGGGAVLAQPAKTFSKNPTGEGDPDAVTCRPPIQLENSRLLGPVVCKPNAEWAQYAKDGMTVSADGRSDVPIKRTGSCQAMGGGGGGATGGGTLSTSMKCD